MRIGGRPPGLSPLPRDALRLSAAKPLRDLHLRGIYMRVIEPGASCGCKKPPAPRRKPKS